MKQIIQAQDGWRVAMMGDDGVELYPVTMWGLEDDGAVVAIVNFFGGGMESAEASEGFLRLIGPHETAGPGSELYGSLEAMRENKRAEMFARDTKAAGR